MGFEGKSFKCAKRTVLTNLIIARDPEKAVNGTLSQLMEYNGA